MQLLFAKYHGAGNDFVIIDNRSELFPKSTNLIKHLCDRHFGIGADGLMLLETATNADFYMRYYNSDGNESTMCGNGGRCITLFAKNSGLIDSSTRFMGMDGEHTANFESPNMINLKMQDVSGVETGDNFYFINTGSPHYVCFVDDVHFNLRFRSMDTHTTTRLARISGLAGDSSASSTARTASS